MFLGAKFPTVEEADEEEEQQERSTTTKEVSEDEVDSMAEDDDECSSVDPQRMQPEIEDLPPLCENSFIELSDDQMDRISELKQQYAELVEVG